MLPQRPTSGQGLVEYAFLLALIAVVVIAALYTFGPSISNVFTRLSSSLSSY